MIESPCTDICTIDTQSNLCIGCGRTANEIAGWVHYTENQKKKLLKDLKKRNNIDNKI
jgi:predicted Fe-S protein YdhL (DUF1289 family)